MAVLVQTRTFFILAALLGRFDTIKAQEVEEYDGGEFLSTSKTIIIIPPLCMQCVYCVIWLISGVEVRELDFCFYVLRRGQRGACSLGFWAEERGLRCEVCGARCGHRAGGAVKGQVLPRGARAEPPSRRGCGRWELPNKRKGSGRGWRTAGQASRDSKHRSLTGWSRLR